MEDLIFTGVQPVKKGGTGNRRWFVIANSGAFSINQNITADIWVVGGGCDGGMGKWLASSYTALGAKGGDGGYVSTYTGIGLKKDEEFYSDIALVNDKSGTTFKASGNIYRCDNDGHTATVGGGGSSLTGDSKGKTYTINYQPGNGVTGVSTPCGVVGSSGGGGMACDGHNHRTRNGKGGTNAGNGAAHQQEGSNAAENGYGCGGGGGDGCGMPGYTKGSPGGTGRQGCIVIQYTVDDAEYIDPVENPPLPQRPPVEPPVEYVPETEEEKKYVIIRHFRRTTTVHNTEVNNAAASSNSCCTTNSSGCECGGSSGNNSYPDGVKNANNTDSIKIGISSMSAAELMSRIQEIETENLALMNQIKELESKLDNT